MTSEAPESTAPDGAPSASGAADAERQSAAGHRERIEKRLRIASILVIVGLAVEAASFLGLHHPFGFMSFAVFGGLLLAAGILYYLWSLVA